MLMAAITFFILAAFGGLFLLTAILKDRPTSKPVAVLHGSIAGIGLLLLIAYVVTRPVSGLLLTSLGLFIVAALGGFTLFVMDISKKQLPKLVAVLHPLLAVTALVLLIISIVYQL